MRVRYKKCYLCGKDFDTTSAYLKQWVYKISSNGLLKYFCSYTCMNAYKNSDQAKEEREKYNRELKESRKDARKRNK